MIQTFNKWTESGCQWRLCMLTSELTVHMLKMYCKEGTSVVLSSMALLSSFFNTIYWRDTFFDSEDFRFWKHQRLSATVLFGTTLSGGRLNKVFFYGDPRSNPFPLKYYFWQKKYLFQIPSTDKWYHFHIPSGEHCTPFNSCVNVQSLKYEKMLYQYVL